MKKYKFTGETRFHNGATVYQIVAVKDFGDVENGDIGGWIETESNLSHDGECWVFDSAIAMKNARVCCNAQLTDSSIASGSCLVSGSATVKGKAKITGEAQLIGFAKIWDNTRMHKGVKSE